MTRNLCLYGEFSLFLSGKLYDNIFVMERVFTRVVYEFLADSASTKGEKEKKMHETK